jgi:uncharacterized protein YecE (DUF72 family)
VDLVRIGTVDLPARLERERYFGELSYLELSALFAGPLKPAALARWAHAAPEHTLGLVAPFTLTHRKPPAGAKLWPHDDATGDFRDSSSGRAALESVRAAVTALHADMVVFRSPDTYSASAAHRERLKQFFAEIATPSAVGAAERVWVPGGLWDARTAAKFASEIEVACALDPLAREPGDPVEIFYDLDAPSLYFRIERGGSLGNARLDDLAGLAEHYAGRRLVFAFATPERWQDARTLKKLLGL